jgi:hypothetical protein
MKRASGDAIDIAGLYMSPCPLPRSVESVPHVLVCLCVRPRTKPRNKSRAPVLIGYLTAHTMLRCTREAPQLFNHQVLSPHKHPSLIAQHLNVHPTAYKQKRTQAAEHSKARNPYSTNLRNRFAPPCFEDPRLARPDDPSSGSTRPVAWDKDMSVPVAAVGTADLLSFWRER